jgi:polygalacturonase
MKPALAKLIALAAAALLLPFAPAPASAAGSSTVSVLDFGAAADGATLNTDAIQRAIDSCSKQGGGTVHFPAGRYVSGTLLLKDNVTLHLDDQAVLLGSLRIADYQMIEGFRDGRGSSMGYCFIGALGAKNIRIEGAGTIDGRGKELLAARSKEDGGKRPFLFRLVRCDGVSLEGFHLQGPAAWTVHLAQCTNVNVAGIHIASRGLGNNDGIDIDSSTGVAIRHCDIDSGDDAICLKTTSPLPCRDIEVSDCNLKSHWGGIKLGTESVGDFENITVSHCRLADTHGGIKLLSVDGANMRHVTISDLDMTNVTMPIFIRLGSRLKTFRDGDTPRPVGTVSDVTIRNIRGACVSPLAILISGIPGHPVEGVTLENIHLQLPGGGTREDAQAVLPEKETGYPEITLFGSHLPAYGVLARHVRDLKIRGVSLTLKSPDARPALVCQQAENVECSNWTIPAQPGSDCVVRLESMQGAVIKSFKPATAGVFARVQGADSSGIVLEFGGLDDRVKPFELGPGVDPKAVTIR